MIEQIEVKVDAQGLHDITKAVAELVAAKDLAEGLCVRVRPEESSQAAQALHLLPV